MGKCTLMSTAATLSPCTLNTCVHTMQSSQARATPTTSLQLTQGLATTCRCMQVAAVQDSTHLLPPLGLDGEVGVPRLDAGDVHGRRLSDAQRLLVHGVIAVAVVEVGHVAQLARDLRTKPTRSRSAPKWTQVREQCLWRWWAACTATKAAGGREEGPSRRSEADSSPADAAAAGERLGTVSVNSRAEGRRLRL